MSETPTRKQKLRCAIYTRKSTDEGLEQDFNSLDALCLLKTSSGRDGVSERGLSLPSDGRDGTHCRD